MDYEASLVAAEQVIANVVAKYEQMLEDPNITNEHYAKITEAMYKLKIMPDVFVHGLSGKEFGGTASALNNGHFITKQHLPYAEELGKALTQRIVARQRLGRSS